MAKTRRGNGRIALTLIIGLVMGFLLSGPRPLPLNAVGDEPWDLETQKYWTRKLWQENHVLTAPVAIEAHDGRQSTLDAIYYLDYKAATLLATVPSYRGTTGSTRLLQGFARRDLKADFKIPPGLDPHFLMTSASLGGLSEGWSPVFVFETETRQVASYRLTPQMIGGVSHPRFDLLEVRSFGPAPQAASTQ